jgi:hypothetical protein
MGGAKTQTMTNHAVRAPSQCSKLVSLYSAARVTILWRCNGGHNGTSQGQAQFRMQAW